MASATARRAAPPELELAARMRRIVIDQSKRAGVGHIGSSLSVVDILAALYGRVLQEEDVFVLSKGHAALALYAALHASGRLDADTLGSYCDDGTTLAAHPEHALDGVEFSAGSLGHGLAMGAGLALAARMQGRRRRVFVLLSDAECNEGSVWETAMFAAHHRLAGLVAVVDRNGQQGLGYTDDVLSLSPLAARWRAFGWDAHEVDGTDPLAVSSTLGRLDAAAGPPHVVVAETTFGRGVSFMERQVKWHYSPMTDDDYAKAVADLAALEGER